MLPLNRQRLFQERYAANGSQTAFFRRPFCYRAILANHFAIVGQVEAHIEARQRNAANDLIDMIEFGFFGAHKLAPRGGIVEEI